jgi:hypothetical protein
MHDALNWLASFFPTWGVRALCLSIVFALSWWISTLIQPAKVASPWLLKLAAICFVAFILMACFYAFKF